MKKIICILLVLCIFPVCAFALDLDEFNVFASVVGVSELDINEAKVSDFHYGFVKEGCKIYIDEKVKGKIDGIYIIGKGDSFLAYCCAAIHVFDQHTSSSSNYGQLLTMYLMAHTTEEYQAGETQNGYLFFIQKTDGEYMFLIGEA